ncbi:MAG: hypothetical protein DRO67_03850, partial [Candidatus Asgardarchaeum californiense]
GYNNTYDESTNTYDNGYPSGGNYWDDYTGEDNFSGPNQNISGPDGIGDTPYLIPGGSNQDRYPLMHPYGTKYIFDFDDRDPEFITLMGQWKEINTPNAYNGHTRYIKPGIGLYRAAWRVDTKIIPGTYDVYVHKFEHPYMHMMATDAPYAVVHKDGVSGWFYVNQSSLGDEWIQIGTFKFDNSKAQGVIIEDCPSGFVAADAIRLVYTGALSQ